jgi:DNA-binding Xre family transcriptional regulator
MIKWKLRSLMAKQNIKTQDLAAQLKCNPTTISNLKKADTMPRLDGDRISAIFAALNTLADTPIVFSDLIEIE